ncbi:MAG: TIGR00269 family protein [Nitrosopumilus sp.]|nr:TIGR00269 family protein [Nitrosopumilus sp.]
MSCRCGGSAAYTRRYSGQSLCGPCFASSIERKAARTLSRYGMARRGETVAVAVSGGKDSLALLQVMSRLSSSRGFGIRAVTIDEGIPGYRDEALDIASRFCRDMGVRLDVLSYSGLFGTTLEEALDTEGRQTSCAICGTLRRRALDIAAREAGADALATGHNLDDVLQTFLINVISGDTGRIGWMDPGARPDPPRRIKPFCEIYEEEIVFYALTTGIPFQTEPCPHMGEGVRTEVREFLNSLEGRHAGMKNAMYGSVLRLAGMARGADTREGAVCPGCGFRCTGGTCSVCGMLGELGNANIPTRPGIGR